MAKGVMLRQPVESYTNLFMKKKVILKAVRKRRPRKIDPSPLVRKMSALAQPPLSVRTHQNFEKYDVFSIKRADVHCPHLKNAPLSEKCPNWTKLPSTLTADVFYGQPLS